MGKRKRSEIGKKLLCAISATTVVVPSLLVSIHILRGNNPLILSGCNLIYLVCFAILVFVISDSQISWYRQIRSAIRGWLFSLAGSVLLFALCLFLMGIVETNAGEIGWGLLSAFIAVTFECILMTVGKRTREHTAIRRLDGKTGGGARDEEEGGENLFSLATYLFCASVMIAGAILVLRDRYGWLQGERYWWVEMSVVMFMIPSAFFLVVTAWAMLLSPKGENESSVVFWIRYVPGVAALILFMFVASYQWVKQVIDQYGWLGIVGDLLAECVAVIACVRMQKDNSKSNKRTQLTAIVYAISWTLAMNAIVGASDSGELLLSPEFILFMASLGVECVVSATAAWERFGRRRFPSWESDLNAYRHVGIVMTLLCFILYCVFSGRSSNGPLSGVGQCLEDIRYFVLGDRQGVTNAVRCLAYAIPESAEGDSFFSLLANGGMQILLGVVTVEYYIAFRAASKNREEDKPRRKTLRQRMYL